MEIMVIMMKMKMIIMDYDAGYDVDVAYYG